MKYKYIWIGLVAALLLVGSVAAAGCGMDGGKPRTTRMSEKPFHVVNDRGPGRTEQMWANHITCLEEKTYWNKLWSGNEHAKLVPGTFYWGPMKHLYNG